MDRIRTLLVDDEPLALDLLRLECARIPHAEVVGEATDGAEALRAIAELKPDMVLIDIQMPVLNGLSVLRDQVGWRPQFVFVTAHANFAVDAFDLEAADYLVKPVRPDRLARAFDRVRRKLLTHAAAGVRPAEEDGADAIWVSGREGYVRVPLADIDWIESDRDYVLIHTGGRSHILRATLTSIAQRLDPRVFVQARRSALIRLAAIRGVHRIRRGLLELALSDGARVRVSRGHTAEVKTALGLVQVGFA
ncbi:MAG: DNA-binding response regulator [Phenylobacterium zucineum]|nr:MAG: DNA-binding response regulator [Phenylobacterium zucineum]